MLYSDVHLHVNPLRGYGAERIAKRFRDLGGWFIAIVGLPPYYYGFTEPSVNSYKKVVELIGREAEKAREQGLQVAKFIGIHPAEIDNYYKQGLKPGKILSLVDAVLKVIEEALKNNVVTGIGEVGRQHYSTTPEKLALSEAMMIRALMLAREYRVPVQLHLEQGGTVTAYSIKVLVDLVKIDPKKVIMHHADFETALGAEELNIPFTAPIRYFNEKYASYPWKYCMIESDFLDDPSRPGVSAYPWDIPRVVEDLIKRGVINEERAYRILIDNVVKYLDVKPP